MDLILQFITMLSSKGAETQMSARNAMINLFTHILVRHQMCLWRNGIILVFYQVQTRYLGSFKIFFCIFMNFEWHRSK